MLGDSAFVPSNQMVPAFKKPARAEMGMFEKFFNTKLAKARIKTEHVIGLIKARFPRLKRMRVRVGCTKSMEKIVKQMILCTILHNMLVDQPLPDNALIEYDSSLTSEDDIIDDDDESDNYDLEENMNFTIKNYNTTEKNTTRREEVMAKVLEYFNQS